MNRDTELLARIKHLEQAIDDIKTIMHERDKEWQRGFWYRLVKTAKQIFLGL